jgi:hypothetical protein
VFHRSKHRDIRESQPMAAICFKTGVVNRFDRSVTCSNVLDLSRAAIGFARK